MKCRNFLQHQQPKCSFLFWSLFFSKFLSFLSFFPFLPQFLLFFFPFSIPFLSFLNSFSLSSHRQRRLWRWLMLAELSRSSQVFTLSQGLLLWLQEPLTCLWTTSWQWLEFSLTVWAKIYSSSQATLQTGKLALQHEWECLKKKG